MSVLRNFKNLTENERLRMKFTFEEGVDKINSFDLKAGGRDDLAELINDFITGYKSEVEQDNALAEALVKVVNEHCRDEFYTGYIHNSRISYEPMAANVANLMIDEVSKNKEWPDSMDYRMLNKRLFASIDGKEQIDMVKAYVDAAPSPNSRYLSYAAFSNVNFGDEYRNKLFAQTMENVPYIGAYFTNATPEMEAFCNERLAEILSGETDHLSGEIDRHYIGIELSYIQKDCPNVMTAENIKEILSGMNDKEICNAIDIMANNPFSVNIDKEMMVELISAAEKTEMYQNATNPLNDAPTEEEQNLLDYVELFQEKLARINRKEARDSLQPPKEKDEVEEVL